MIKELFNILVGAGIMFLLVLAVVKFAPVFVVLAVLCAIFPLTYVVLGKNQYQYKRLMMIKDFSIVLAILSAVFLFTVATGNNFFYRGQGSM